MFFLDTEILNENTYINEEDNEEVENDKHIFKNIQKLNLKDFSETTEKNGKLEDISLLRININGEQKLVKKSTLCWLFFSKIRRLSSDRIVRCKSMGSSMGTISRTTNETSKVPQNSKNRGKNRVNNSRKDIHEPRLKEKITKMRKDYNQCDTEISSESDTSYSVHSEFENESFSDIEMTSEMTDKQHESSESLNANSCSTILVESYYAVCYKTWYVGRVIERINEESSKIKFLKCELDGYIWPKEEDVQIVRNTFIFYGPIELIGNGPFYLKRQQKLEIEKRFKSAKKDLKEFL